MTYDEAIKKLDTILRSMETDEALSMEQFKKCAAEAKQLISFCENQLTGLQKEMQEAVK